MKTCTALRARDSGETQIGVKVLDVSGIAFAHLVEDDHPFGWHPDGLLHLEGAWKIEGGELVRQEEDPDAP